YNLLNLFPLVPTTGQLQVIPTTQQSIYRVASDFQSPMFTLGGIQVERQLPRNITGYVGFYTFRITHVIRARDINAPLPGTITAARPKGIRPNRLVGAINQSESSGKYRQSQVILGANRRLDPRIALQGTFVLATI